MGLFDQLAGQVLGSLNSGSNQTDDNNPLIQIAGSLLQSQGGLSGLLAKFQQSGLGEQAASWVSTGENMPIDGSHVTQALGHDTVAELASKFGLSGDQVSAGLSAILPQLIDRMTPQGTTEDATTEAGGLDLSSMLGGLLSKA